MEDDLSTDVKESLSKALVPENIPFLDLMAAKEALRTTNHTMSQAPGDLPASLRKEFYQWLAEPFLSIMRRIVVTGEWPAKWKQEWGTPIPKEALPITNEDQLRIISITNKMSMTAERFLLKWMWPYLKVHMDRDQFGGTASNSVSHYLIELTNFILYNIDLSTPLTTIMTMVDFSKGFNRVHHAALINELHSLGIPAWILRIVKSYLSNRELRIRYKEGISEPASLPGGLGQGTLMGIWMFFSKYEPFQ